MRHLFAAALLAATFAGAGPQPASAQISMGAQKDPLQLQYEREENARKENERQYNETMKRLKSQRPTANSADPWKTVRPADRR